MAKLTDLADGVKVRPVRAPTRRHAHPAFSEAAPMPSAELAAIQGLEVPTNNPFVRKVMEEVAQEIARLGPGLRPHPNDDDALMPTTQGAAMYIRAFVSARTNEKKRAMLVRAAAALIACVASREDNKCNEFLSQGPRSSSD